MRLNGKGYKVLPSYYRIIQGDGNDTEDDINEILGALERAGYSASNIAFGMGGGLLQKLDRDTQKFAFKLSELSVNGVARTVRKNPITDPGKMSKAGRLDLVKIDGEYQTIARTDADKAYNSEMRTVYVNGHIDVDESFDTVRERAARSFR
jgi:nicotinamide phosphoribosyltransferase